MTDLVSAIADFLLLALVFASDILIDGAPLMMYALGALALAVGFIAWPLESAEEDRSGRGII